MNRSEEGKRLCMMVAREGGKGGRGEAPTTPKQTTGGRGAACLAERCLRECVCVCVCVCAYA